MKKIKLPLKILLGVLALLLLVILGYVIYVFAAYYRVEDNQVLPVESMNGADHGGPEFWTDGVLDIVDAFCKRCFGEMK